MRRDSPAIGEVGSAIIRPRYLSEMFLSKKAQIFSTNYLRPCKPHAEDLKLNSNKLKRKMGSNKIDLKRGSNIIESTNNHYVNS